MMKNPDTILEKIIFTTVKIESFKGKSLLGSGTGFLISYMNLEKNSQYIFLFTNKHVIDNSDRWRLLFNKDKNGNPKYGDPVGADIGNVGGINTSLIDSTLRNLMDPWIRHPKYDIAMLPFAQIYSILEKNNKKPYFKTHNYKQIPTEKEIEDNIDAIENILFIGYPNDVYDKTNLIPVVRRGITATPISIDFEGEPFFLIDASVFPGSSGSPVIICDVGIYKTKKDNAIINNNRIYLLGILSSGYYLTETNEIKELSIPIISNRIVKNKQMIDLGVVIKSSVIAEMMDNYIKE